MNSRNVLATLLIIANNSLAIGQQNQFTLINSSNDYSLTTIHFEVADFNFKNVNTQNGIKQIIQAAGATPILKAGFPDLPKFSKSVIVPDLAQMEVEILTDQYIDYQNINIAPSLGNLSRINIPNDNNRVQGAVYSQNEFYPSQISILRNPYILNDFRAAVLVVQPFQYNPVTHVLRVHTSISIKIKQNSLAAINPFNRIKPTHLTNENAKMYTRHFLNYSNSRYTPISEDGEMLIIAHGPFMNAMQPFVKWKNEKGIKTVMVNVSNVGNNAASIKNYITSYYQNHPLSYVILVGDIAQIASPTLSGGKSDPSYGYIIGEDAYPEIIIGRISAETEEHVTTQVQKFIQYEKNPIQVSHFTKTMGVASNEGPGDDDEMDWEHIRNIQGKLLNYSYTDRFEFYDGDQGEQDLNGDPNAANIEIALNNGVGIINYCGHGSCTSWGSSGFNTADINLLNNTNKLPFIWSVACVNGEFDNGTCYGEAWLRAKNNGNLTGAVGAFMSSINQSWNPPMAAQDEMVDVLTQTIADVNTRTFGGISISGCLKMNDEYGAAGDEMTNTWHIFGDPTLMVRTANPNTMVVNHASSTNLGTITLPVNVNVENALVAISQNGNLLGKSNVSASVAIINFEAISNLDSLTVTVTAFNYIPYQGKVAINQPTEAFVVINEAPINDPLGNQNQLADYNENVNLGLTLRNEGETATGSLLATVSTTSQGITITNNTCQISSIAPEGSFNIASCIQFEVSNSIEDQTEVLFDIIITDNDGNQWNNSIPVTIHAPKIIISNYSISDISGNNNNRLDAGENATITVNYKNIGHSKAINGLGNITASSFISPLSNNQNLLDLEVNEEGSNNINFQVLANAPIGSQVQFNFQNEFGFYQDSLTTIERIGLVIEDAESANFTQNPWINDSSIPWEVDVINKYQGENCFVSGNIEDNGSTELIINYTVISEDTLSFMRKISSEEGYDFLRFYVDDNLRSEWSGTSDWMKEKFEVQAGQHSFKWVYEKDEMVSAGDDAAWIDWIVFPAGNFLEQPNGIKSESSNLLIKIFPNPINTSFTLSYQADRKDNVDVTIIDLTGRVICTFDKLKIVQGANTAIFQLPDSISNGSYIIKISGVESIHCEKISVFR
jgi:hypothetical protein